MTLPKNITDAIDVLLQRACKTLTSAYSMPADEYLRICTEQARAALEAAIADHIADAGKKVEPPTDAEVEAWEKQAKRVLHWPDENRDHPDAVFVVSIRTLADGLALMRRARATGSWNGGPTITALMRGVEDAAIEWGKCCGDYHAACQAAPPPSGLQATDAVREAGHRCELTYGYFQKAIKALADHGTQTGSLERLRERVQKEADNACEDYSAGLWRAVELIDEERGAGR